MIKRIRRLWQNWFITKLNVSYTNRTSLPENLPQSLRYFYSPYNKLTSLPDNLPQRLQDLYCSDNQLTSLPDKLPQNLYVLDCSYNQLTSLPDKLPQSLQKLYCYDNQLTSLPDNLPQSLQILGCYDNRLISLPDILPQSLEELYCSNNQLTILPDLPNSLIDIDLFDNPLQANYPDIFTFNDDQAGSIISYVNGRNREMRRACMQTIDPTNRILEIYMQRMMHPDRLAALAADVEADVDEWMGRYVDSL